MSSYNPLQNAFIWNAPLKKGIMNKSILWISKGGHFESANVKCPFALSKMPLYIPWQNSLIKNALLKNGILKKGLLSKDRGGHIWEGKRAFPSNRQKSIFGLNQNPQNIVQLFGHKINITKGNIYLILHILKNKIKCYDIRAKWTKRVKNQ